MASATLPKHQSVSKHVWTSVGRAVRLCQLTLRVLELQRIITILFGKVARVANLFAVINAAYFLTIFRAGHSEQFGWSECFQVVDAMPPVVVFREGDNFDVFFAVTAICVV